VQINEAKNKDIIHKHLETSPLCKVLVAKSYKVFSTFAPKYK